MVFKPGLLACFDEKSNLVCLVLLHSFPIISLHDCAQLIIFTQEKYCNSMLNLFLHANAIWIVTGLQLPRYILSTTLSLSLTRTCFLFIYKLKNDK